MNFNSQTVTVKSSQPDYAPGGDISPQIPHAVSAGLGDTRRKWQTPSNAAPLDTTFGDISPEGALLLGREDDQPRVADSFQAGLEQSTEGCNELFWHTQRQKPLGFGRNEADFRVDISFDWLDARTPEPISAEKFEELQAFAFEGKTETKEMNVRNVKANAFWDFLTEDVRGVEMLWRRQEDGYTALVTHRGKTLTHFPDVLEVIERARTFHEHFGMQLGRGDVCLEDFSKRVTVQMFHEEIKRGSLAVVRSAPHSGDLKPNKSLPKNCVSLTQYVGSKQSNSYVAVYDAWVKHGRESTRIEARFKQDMAKGFWDKVLSWESYEIFANHRHGNRHGFGNATPPTKDGYRNWIKQKLARIIFSKIQLREGWDTRKDNHLKRVPEVKWWKEFKESIAIGIDKVRSVKLRPTFISRMAHFKRNCMGTMRKLGKDVGNSRLMQIVREELRNVDTKTRSVLSASINDIEQLLSTPIGVVQILQALAKCDRRELHKFIDKSCNTMRQKHELMQQLEWVLAVNDPTFHGIDGRFEELGA